MFEGKQVVLDLDDTLSFFRDEVMVEFNAITGKKRHWTDWEVLHVEKLYDVPDFLSVAYGRKLTERARPHGEASHYLSYLKSRGLKITILTARGWHPRAQEITESWLRLWDIPFDEVIVCQLHDCKADYIRHMDNVLFYVDDSKSHCNKTAALTENRPEFVFAYAQKWNEGTNEGVIRINNLLEVGKHIEGL